MNQTVKESISIESLCELEGRIIKVRANLPFKLCPVGDFIGVVVKKNEDYIITKGVIGIKRSDILNIIKIIK